jgi:hypothetical protein
MLRMLDQSDLVICSQNTATIEIPIIFFPFSWVKFVGSSNPNQSGESVKIGLIEVAACLLLFDECFNKRNMSITSNLLPTCAIDPSQGLKEPFVSPKYQEECYACTQLMGLYGTLV